MPRTDPLPAGISRRSILRSIAAAAAAAGFTRSGAQAHSGIEPALGHPRLWITEDDVLRFRAWATPDNPLWESGILSMAADFATLMDDGTIPGSDDGGLAWIEYPTENAAQLFAFMFLVHPDEAARADYGERARSLLMFAIGEAAKGVAEGQPFRDPYFSIFDRSRWWGAGFPLTVDWIYPLLSAEEKSTIREVFLRWIGENAVAEVTGDANHPQPVGVVNDPALLSEQRRVRWAANNYFTAHMRNIGLMALSLDPEDDPDGELAGNLSQATGAWLYMVDAVLQGDSRGGLTAEGFEYTPLALAYVAQFLLALQTAGQANPDMWGSQVLLSANPFWDDLIPAMLHSFSPATSVLPDIDYLGSIYQAAWFGDGEIYAAPDFIGLLGAIGRYDEATGNTARLETIRWIQTHMQSGGEENLLWRQSYGYGDTHIAMFYFMLFDPAGVTGSDPRPALPLDHFAAGIGRQLARTGWDPDATWFTWALGWNAVDHQHSDGNQFEFYRKGEWLTKERTGYGFAIGSSDYHNTLALENDPPDHFDPSDYRYEMWARGSQWMIVAGGDPDIIARSVTDDYFYALGDATNLYNSTEELSTDILHASRSIVWLKPDHIVVYDRAASRTDGRFKRFWLNFPAEATVDDRVTMMTTDAGQQLVVTTLLPVDAEIAAEPAELLEGEVALGEQMKFRLRVEAPGGPAETRFLHVLQGADAGVTPDTAVLIEGEGGSPFAGVSVAGWVVLFPVDATASVESLAYSAPAGTRHLITGLVPGSQWDAGAEPAGDGVVVTLQPGTTHTADDAGVLDIAM